MEALPVQPGVLQEYSPKINKMFFIPQDYANPTKNYGHGRLAGRLFRQEMQVLDIFKTHGFNIVRDQIFTGKTGEIGIDSDPKFERNLRRNNRIIAEKAGVIAPCELHLGIRNNLEFPLVAKSYLKHRGEGIYKIDDLDQLIRFETAVQLGANTSDFLQNPQLLTRLFDDVYQGDLTSPLFERNEAFWIYQEYSESASDHHVTFRVIADAHGDTHGAELMYSVLTKESVTGIINHERRKQRISNRGDAISQVLNDPKSPFFIDSEDIVSYDPQTDTSILLNGIPRKNSTEIAILTDLQIDPDNPVLPDKLAEIASSIGFLLRGSAPYVGIDFQLNAADLQPVLLEVGHRPSLDADVLGIDHGQLTDNSNSFPYISQNVLEQVLLQRIAGK